MCLLIPAGLERRAPRVAIYLWHPSLFDSLMCMHGCGAGGDQATRGRSCTGDSRQTLIFFSLFLSVDHPTLFVPKIMGWNRIANPLLCGQVHATSPPRFQLPSKSVTSLFLSMTHNSPFSSSTHPLLSNCDAKMYFPPLTSSAVFPPPLRFWSLWDVWMTHTKSDWFEGYNDDAMCSDPVLNAGFRSTVP